MGDLGGDRAKGNLGGRMMRERNWRSLKGWQIWEWMLSGRKCGIGANKAM